MKGSKFHLLAEAIIRFVLLLCALGAILFVSAGTTKFIAGWIALCALMVPVMISGMYFFFRNPEMLKKRVTHQEQDPRQQKLVILCTAVFALGIIGSGISFRFSFLVLPPFCSVMGTIPYAFALGIYLLAYTANPFLSKSVLVQDDQFVVDTGIYSKIRHPFYLATTLFYFAISIALNSLITIIVFLLLIPILKERIVLEEEYLCNSLPGYRDYMIRVPYRLIPAVW